MYPGKLGGLSALFTRRIWLLFKLVYRVGRHNVGPVLRYLLRFYTQVRP
jgi:hypothetical protein